MTLPKKGNIRTIITILMLSVVVIPFFSSTSSAQTPAPSQPKSYFTATDHQTVSGKFSLVVQANSTVDGVYYWLEGPGSGVSNPYTAVPADSRNPYFSAETSPNYWGFIWDSTQVPNGVYRWAAALKCGNCNTLDWVYTRSDQRALTVVVDNPVAPTTPAQGRPERPSGASRCDKKLTAANAVTKTIVDKVQNRLLYIDNFSQQVQSYYVKKSISLVDYDLLSKAASDASKKASDDLVVLRQKSILNCDTKLAPQIADFRKQLGVVRDDLDTYKDSVIDIILGVLKVS